mmetsp:Transcript_27623/g.79724  ORF Transcript_27623/g.79724 Transcript_27623/m.79724 type:complete len:640 (+) Transcript_27623:139-2058(+)
MEKQPRIDEEASTATRSSSTSSGIGNQESVSSNRRRISPPPPSPPPPPPPHSDDDAHDNNSIMLPPQARGAHDGDGGGGESIAEQGGLPETPELRLSRKLRHDQSLRMWSHSTSAPTSPDWSRSSGTAGEVSDDRAGSGVAEEGNGPTLTPDERLSRKLQSSTISSLGEEGLAVDSAGSAAAAARQASSGTNIDVHLSGSGHGRRRSTASLTALEDDYHQRILSKSESRDIEGRLPVTNASDDHNVENGDDALGRLGAASCGSSTGVDISEIAVNSCDAMMATAEAEGAASTSLTPDEVVDPERADGSPINPPINASAEQDRSAAVVSPLYFQQQRHRSSAMHSVTDDTTSSSQDHAALPPAEVSAVISTERDNEYGSGDFSPNAEAVPAYKPDEIQVAAVVTSSKMCCMVIHSRRFVFAAIVVAVLIAAVVGAVIATEKTETQLEGQTPNAKTPITQENIQIAVDSWINAPDAAERDFGHIKDWDTSQVSNMQDLFHDKRTFNDDISRWNLSRVNRMNGMFSGSELFNQDLSKWDVSSVRYMSGLFRGALAFNVDISDWDVSSVTSMNNVLRDTKSFTHTLCWDLSSVESMMSWDHGFGDCLHNLKVCGAFCGSSGSFNATCASEELIQASQGCGSGV